LCRLNVLDTGDIDSNRSNSSLESTLYIHAPPQPDAYQRLAGVRKAHAPIPQEPFPMSEQEFPTHEAAAKTALEECMKKIDAGFAA